MEIVLIYFRLFNCSIALILQVQNYLAGEGLSGSEIHQRSLVELEPDFLERAKGLEPSTSTLGRWHSTTELRPLRH